MQVAAALSYYSILSIFPGLIFLSAVLSLLLLGNVFSQLLTLFTTPVIYLGFDRLGKLLRRNLGSAETQPEGARR